MAVKKATTAIGEAATQVKGTSRNSSGMRVNWVCGRRELWLRRRSATYAMATRGATAATGGVTVSGGDKGTNYNSQNVAKPDCWILE